MSELMVKVENVKKEYKLGAIGGTTLRDEIARKVAKVMKKEDPTKKIGAKDINTGEKFMALNGVSFEVKKGEAIGIIGHNGAGKSTLLKLITRITAPTEGNIYLNGRVASMLEVGTGFHPELTGRENIYLNGAILGMTKKEIDAKMEQIIDFSEVRKFIDTPVKRYSSGMYVKLAFSVASHLDSEIMIMDEVLAVGDVNFQQKCLKKMRDIAKVEGRTVLYVSHNMSTIKTLCDRCIVLDKGEVVYVGDVDEAINVYSKNEKIKPLLEYDYTNVKRNHEITNLFVMKKAKLEKTVVDIEEPFVFSLDIETKNKCDNLLIRFVVFGINGAVIGTTYSKMFSVNNGENKLKFSFPTEGLVPGTYMVDLILCGFDGKIQLRHDIINTAFNFSINESKILYNMKWIKGGWGSVKFKEMIVDDNR